MEDLSQAASKCVSCLEALVLVRLLSVAPRESSDYDRPQMPRWTCGDNRCGKMAQKIFMVGNRPWDRFSMEIDSLTGDCFWWI